jgi:hypothetical protein
MDDRRIAKRLLTTRKGNERQDAHNKDGGISIIFKRTEQATYGLIHEDDEFDYPVTAFGPCGEFCNVALK